MPPNIPAAVQQATQRFLAGRATRVGELPERCEALRADLQQVFAEARAHQYLVFVTGPSRTADIELTVTLGVHGSQSLHVWVL